jgi:bleomycin hydrolase
MRKIILFLLVSFSLLGHSQGLSISQFGLKIPEQTNCTSVKDQSMSSTCWSFASNSLLESEMLRKGEGIDLSEMFVARYSYIRKVKRHLELKGNNFFTPGGQFHDMIWVAKNYGMVPESAYSGKGRGETSHNQFELDGVIEDYVKKLLAKGETTLNDTEERFVDSVLDHYLGKVPTTFEYEGVNYTPTSFLVKFLKFNPDDYVEITSYTHHPFYKPFILENKFNWTNDAYYNVTMQDFSRITDSALKNGYTVGWDGDADDPDFHFNEGLAFLSFPIKNYQLERQSAFETKKTDLDHMMHITGVTKDKNGKEWYYIKNSWGAINELNGFLFMREDYFKIRTVAIIVNKNAIPADIRKKLAL